MHPGCTPPRDHRRRRRRSSPSLSSPWRDVWPRFYRVDISHFFLVGRPYLPTYLPFNYVPAAASVVGRGGIVFAPIDRARDYDAGRAVSFLMHFFLCAPRESATGTVIIATRHFLTRLTRLA